MKDIYDIIAIGLFGAILAVGVQVVVTLGSLPGEVAKKRDHPQTAAINIASWVGIATLALGAVVGGTDAISFILMGILWPVALVWAFQKPITAGPPLAVPQPEGHQRPGGREMAS
jgi:hypothetical protein